MKSSDPTTSRRRFLRTAALLSVAGHSLLRTSKAKANARETRLAAARSANPAAWPAMEYRTLGRTGWNASRLVFGCGAALARGRRDELLDTAFDAGVNVFDVGFRGYYRDAEKNLAPFLKRRRDRIFLISKAIAARVEPNESLDAAARRAAANNWSEQLDQSLRELGAERVDAYYVMAANNVDLVGSDEIRRAFEAAREAGKVAHLGLSTHQNAERVLETATSSGVFSLAMIAITPAGWYDWESKGLLPDTRPMTQIRPVLDKARGAGLGLVGMKAGRYLAGRKFLGWSKTDAFDEHYGADYLASGLSAYQRSYAYVLAHGLDVVNADMQSIEHLSENFAAAARSSQLFA